MKAYTLLIHEMSEDVFTLPGNCETECNSYLCEEPATKQVSYLRKNYDRRLTEYLCDKCHAEFMQDVERGELELKDIRTVNL